MPSQVRLERVRELLKREIGEVVRREIPLDEAGLISVNDVALAGDLQSATVYVGIIGNAAQKARAFVLLDKERKNIQWQLGRHLVLKYTPVLRFVEDVAIERGNRVLEIIEALEKDPAVAEVKLPDAKDADK